MVLWHAQRAERKILMNKVILMGRLTRDPEVRYVEGGQNGQMVIARYSLAVDRRGIKKDAENTADFINVVAFGKSGEFAEKYLHKGTKVLVTGRIQTGSYTNKDGVKVYTTDVVAEDQEFAESKSAGGSNNEQATTQAPAPAADADGFMNIPEGIDDDLPFARP